METNDHQRNVTASRPRPNAAWVCGYADVGLGCQTGPDVRGHCCRSLKVADSNQPAQPAACAGCAHACAPGQCVASQADGSKSDMVDLPPCIPVRSDWSFRHTLAVNVALLTGASLLLVMSLPQREVAFVPGALSGQHAQIISNTVVSERCSLCHPNAHTQSAVAGQLATQEELCSRCHVKHLPNLHLLSPHDLPRDELRQLTRQQQVRRDRLVSTLGLSSQSSWASGDSATHEPTALTPALSNDSGEPSKSDSAALETRCASCHVEHHGRQQNLQAITDARCQACHLKQFESFHHGHPEFVDYPTPRPRRISFSHQAHREKHFAQKNQTFNCATCHVDDGGRSGVGSVFRTQGFEAACASCHTEPIKAATVDGWVMLQLPSIQPQDTKSSELGLHDWPANAQFGYEGNVPLVMWSLLLADPQANTVLAQLEASGDLRTLAPGPVGHSAATKPASNGLATSEQAIRSVAQATRKLIRDVASTGQVAWRQRIEFVLQSACQRKLETRDQELIDRLCAGLPPDIFRQMEQQWFMDSRLVQSLDTGQSSSEPLAKRPNASPRRPQFILSSQQQLLDDDLLLQPPANKPGNEELVPSAAANIKKPKLTKLRGAIHVVQGGWYLDNDTLSLRYMPRGHADPTLAAWSEFAAMIASAYPKHFAIEPGSSSIPHAEVDSAVVPGGCAQCHTLDQRSLAVESLWKANNRSTTVRELTKFDHTPHLTLPKLSDCQYCHQLRDNSPLPKGFVSLRRANPPVEAGCEFHFITLEACVACHRPNGAGTGCVQCHNYHVTTTQHAVVESVLTGVETSGNWPSAR